MYLPFFRIFSKVSKYPYPAYLINATVSSTFKHVRFKLVRSKVHKNKVAQKCVLIVRSVSDRRANEVNVWGNLISMHLEPNESEPNAFEGRADSSINIWHA